MPRRAAESLLPLELPPVPTDAIERRLRHGGRKAVVGIDEAGRGPLAGPVVAAAVILDPRRIPDGLDDSKKLDRARRETLFDIILDAAVVSVAAASVARIEATDIRQATLWAMRRAVAGLARLPDHAIIDGIDVPPGLPCPGEAVVKGDARSVSIAAASIIAKVTRDRMMQRAAHHFPHYGFEQHMGYGTPLHLAALATHGACILHRATFAPIRMLREGASRRPEGAEFLAGMIAEVEAG